MPSPDPIPNQFMLYLEEPGGTRNCPYIFAITPTVLLEKIRERERTSSEFASFISAVRILGEDTRQLLEQFGCRLVRNCARCGGGISPENYCIGCGSLHAAGENYHPWLTPLPECLVAILKKDGYTFHLDPAIHWLDESTLPHLRIGETFPEVVVSTAIHSPSPTSRP